MSAKKSTEPAVKNYMRTEYVKYLPGLSADQVRRLFDKHVKVGVVASRIPDLEVPQAIRYTNTEIIFEYMSIPPTLADDRMAGKEPEADSLRRVGRALGLFHALQGPLEKVIYVHGDLWFHNACVRDDIVTFFDFDPPFTHRSFEEHYQNTAYYDVGSFLISLYISVPFKHMGALFMNRNASSKAFLQGYESAREQTLPRVLVRRSIWQAFVRWMRWEIHASSAPIRGVFKSMLAAIAIWWQIRVNRICT
jgi:tRNA A-37 threonylcarbamoyl transferase component Bud32